MKFSDETLMAYADGELDPATRTAVERAIRSDPTLAAKVRQHTALRSNVFAAFGPIADEPVPPRLTAATRSGKVIQLNTARAARAEAPQEKRRWSWAEWGGIAAALMVGVLAGGAGVIGLQDQPQLAATPGGTLLAQGGLAVALSTQLAGAAAQDAPVKIGVSFEARDGGYCRTFMMGAAAGLACRNGAEWKVPLMAQAASGAAGAYRQAGSEMPPVVLDAIDTRISGQTLDAKAEEAARARGWQR
ncbi:hypothetical protein HHL21_08715 [Massilia sp. RP-1-19]|uniref:Anti-sigma factor n=1 Tax=Massilia polaris TaxID=2728846 RepID=A0A848HLX2_9BURK|nr:hypothetical protein [Massilia polaris]NML61160.1 hypothetical protein [Massilia polaris]